MKLRSKLLLSATCLLTISVAATATSAYAWFTANRQVYLKSTATVDTKVTNLKVKGFDAVTGDGDTAGFSQTAVSGDLGSVDSNVAITDISGDGKTFYKPELPADKSTDKAMSIKQVKNGTPKNTNYYHQFKLEFSQTNISISTGVFLAKESSVDAVDTTGGNSAKDSALANSIRVSITVGTKTIYWAPNETLIGENETSINKFYLDGETASEVSLLEANSKEVKSTSGIENRIIGEPTDINDASSDKSTATELLGILNSSTESLTATIRVWAEGMDTNCNNDALGGHINVNLVFNGVNMSI